MLVPYLRSEVGVRSTASAYDTAGWAENGGASRSEHLAIAAAAEVVAEGRRSLRRSAETAHASNEWATQRS
jgi:hypothetical protein